jgi:hypothetical protein
MHEKWVLAPFVAILTETFIYSYNRRPSWFGLDIHRYVYLSDAVIGERVTRTFLM